MFARWTVRLLWLIALSSISLNTHADGKVAIDYVAFEEMKIGGSDDFESSFDPAKNSMRINVPKEGEKNWSVVHHSPNSTVAIAEGDILVYTLDMRVTGKHGEVGDIGIYAESSVPEKSGSVGGRVQPTTTRQSFRRSVISPGNYEPGEFRVAVHLATQPQELEFFGAKLEVYPADTPSDQLGLAGITWEGRQPDAEWRAEAAKRIDQLRRSDMTIRVVDADGTPIENAKVRATLSRHAWRFGTFVGPTLLADSDDGERYREEVLGRFNFLTLPTYLAEWGWLNPQSRRNYFSYADWARDHDLPARGHLLVYPGWTATPSSWFEIPKPELRRRMAAHIPRAIAALRPRGVTEWDVTNELRMNKDFMNEIGGVEVAADWFQLARQHNPDGVHYLNETFILSNGGSTESEQKTLEQQFQTLVQKGASIDGIGLQGHFGSEFTPPKRLHEILDRMGKLTGKIMITEFDMDNEDKIAQADYLRDFYTVCFAHPAVMGVVRWGFWEGEMWKPRGHSLTRDWAETPLSRMHEDLVHRQWHTDAVGTTDRDGEMKIRGYKGQYELSVEFAGYQDQIRFELGDDAVTHQWVVPGDRPLSADSNEP